MADLDLIPVSWDSNNINDDTNFEAGFSPGIEWGLPAVRIEQVKRLQKWPLISSVTRPGRTLDMIIRILNTDVRTYRDLLELWFSPEDESPKLLVIEDEDGTNDRYVQAICETLEPLIVNSRACNDAFFVTVRIHGDVRWRKTSVTTATWNVTASGNTVVVTNAGSDDAFPTITLKPTADKSSADFLYKSFITVRWRTDEAFTNYPLDVVNNGLDTDALIKTGTSTTLNGNVLAGDTTITLTNAAAFPTNGMAYITDVAPGDEQISWTGKAGNDLTGCSRGLGGTTDANHTNGDTIEVSKMLANGDDLTIEIDGVDVDRWLQDIDNATTQVWVNVDFSAKFESTIVSGITAVESVTTIEVDDDIDDAPDEGILIINTEIFSYTSKNNADKEFQGITRTINGSSAGVHAAGDTIWWCQHSIWLKYGDEGASTPTLDNTVKPMMDLDSTNISWTYSSFGSDAGTRSGQWQQSTSWGSPTYTGGNQGSDADPWSDMGVTCIKAKARYKLFNPCEMTNANFTNGEKYSSRKADFQGRIRSWHGHWHTEYTIPDPAADDTYEAWSQSVAITAGRRTQISMECRSGSNSLENRVEVSDCVVTLDSGNTPVIVIVTEQGMYHIDATLYNQSTSITLGVNFATQLNQELEIDTDDKTVTDNRDGSSQLKAKTLIGGARRDWFKLRPNTNTLTFTDIGTAGITVTFEYEERYF